MHTNYNDEIWLTIPDAARPLDDALVAVARSETGRIGAGRVLDLGCGDGAYADVLGERGADVLGLDCSTVAVERARRRAPGARFMTAEADRELPLEDGSIDLVWCVDALEHFLDVQTALLEIRRVLHRDGTAVIATPGHAVGLRLWLAVGGWNGHFDPFSPHIRFFTRRSLRATLVDCGLTSEIDRRGELLVARAKAD